MQVCNSNKTAGNMEANPNNKGLVSFFLLLITFNTPILGSGYSTNWGTGEQENGVSCFFKDKENLYTHIYGLQDLKKIKIVGWYLGEHGTDGEPLLLHAKEIKA